MPNFIPTMYFDRDGGTVVHFWTERGGVFVLVTPQGEGRAKIRVEDDTVALAAQGDEDSSVTYARPEAKAAVNRFGTGVMLGIMRWVRERTPSVREWIVERKSGANPGRRAVVEV